MRKLDGTALGCKDGFLVMLGLCEGICDGSLLGIGVLALGRTLGKVDLPCDMDGRCDGGCVDDGDREGANDGDCEVVGFELGSFEGIPVAEGPTDTDGPMLGSDDGG